MQGLAGGAAQDPPSGAVTRRYLGARARTERERELRFSDSLSLFRDRGEGGPIIDIHVWGDPPQNHVLRESVPPRGPVVRVHLTAIGAQSLCGSNAASNKKLTIKTTHKKNY